MMKAFLRSTSLLAGVFVFFAVNTGWAELTVDNYTLVSSKRVSRVEYEYTYRADVNNNGGDVKNVMAQVSSSSPYTTVIEGVLDFGDVLAGASITASDTFIIKHNRRYPLDWSGISWNFHYGETVSVVGTSGGAISVTDTSSGLLGAGVDVPAGALSADTPITIDTYSGNLGLTSSNVIIDYGPDGTSFSSPVNITIPFLPKPSTSILGDDTNDIFTYDTNEGNWKVVDKIDLDTQTGIIVGSTDHFSSFTASGDEVVHETPSNISSGDPILLIHGVAVAPLDPQGDCSSTFGNLKDYLSELGYDVWSFNYNTARWIEITAGNLSDAISGIINQKNNAGYTGTDKLTIICHSMGGLVTRTYVQRYGMKWTGYFPWPETRRIGYNNDVDRIFMIATPNHGSVWGAINYAAAIEPHARQISDALRFSSAQMIPGSNFLTNLNDVNNSINRLPTDIDYHVIHGNFAETYNGEQNDGIVLRSSSELSEWKAIGGYKIQDRVIGAAHVRIPGFWYEGVAKIDTKTHPTWAIISSILNPGAGGGSGYKSGLYVLDSADYDIHLYESIIGLPSKIVDSSVFQNPPIDFAFDQSGNLLVVEKDAGVRIFQNGQSTYSQTIPNVDAQYIMVDDNGLIYISARKTASITVYNPDYSLNTTFSYTNVLGSHKVYEGPGHMDMDPSTGNIVFSTVWAATGPDRGLLEIDKSGTIITYFGPGWYTLTDCEFGAYGNLYVWDGTYGGSGGSYGLRVFDSSRQQTDLLFSGQYRGSPRIAFDNQTLYVSDYFGGKIDVYDIDNHLNPSLTTSLSDSAIQSPSAVVYKK